MKRYIAILILIATLCAALYGVGAVAYADTAFDYVVEDFDNTYVLSDLKGATIWGKTFDKNDYPKDENGELRLLEFAEYCFSTKYELQQHYGLYLYVYNPQAIAFVNDVRNKIEIAVDYEIGDDGEVKVTRYDKLRISICSVSSDGLFYKFKIDDVSEIYSRVAQSPESRRYDIIGVELVAPYAINAHDYKVGGVWVYSGYAKGCHFSSESESTLRSDIKSTNTIDLDNLQFTYYRTWQSAVKANQLTSVYFSVPHDIAVNYDVLYSIQAETYQYLTSPIFCVYDDYYPGLNALVLGGYDKLFADLLKQRNISTPHLHDSSMDRILYWDVLGDASRFSAFTGYNYLDSPIKDFVPYTTLAWLFQVSLKDKKDKDEFTVSSDKLLKYMAEYSDEFNLHDIRGKYSSALFANKYYSIFADYAKFESGYLPLDIDISGEFDFTLLGSDTKYNVWKSLFGKWDGTIESEPICPIVEVSYDEIKYMDAETISKTFFIAKNDVAAFKTYVRNQGTRHTYLFHFALSDYFTTDVYNNYGLVGYMAQEVAYLDFDIISLGYSKDGVVTILPVVCSPIDIIASVEPGQDPPAFLVKKDGVNVLGIVLAVVLVVLVFWCFSKILHAFKGKK